MNVRILVAVIASLCTVVSFSDGQQQPEDVREGARNQKFIPVVFISSEALKNLQDRAQQNIVMNQLGHENQANSEPLISSIVPQDLTAKVNPPNADNQRIQIVKPVLVTQLASPIQQPILANRQPLLANQQATLIGTPITANQPLSIQQPMLVNQASLPNQQTTYVTQSGLSNQQPLLITQQPGQTILLNQQPSLTGQQATVVSQQPSPSQQLVLQNGQVAQIAYPQTTVVQKPTHNPSTLYAVVSNVPNQGVSNVNSYLVPVQQLQQVPNTLTINGK